MWVSFWWLSWQKTCETRTSLCWKKFHSCWRFELWTLTVWQFDSFSLGSLKSLQNVRDKAAIDEKWKQHTRPHPKPSNTALPTSRSLFSLHPSDIVGNPLFPFPFPFKNKQNSNRYDDSHSHLSNHRNHSAPPSNSWQSIRDRRDRREIVESPSFSLLWAHMTLNEKRKPQILWTFNKILIKF